MPELPMAPARADQIPTVCFNDLNHVSHFHASIARPLLRINNDTSITALPIPTALMVKTNDKLALTQWGVVRAAGASR